MMSKNKVLALMLSMILIIGLMPPSVMALSRSGSPPYDGGETYTSGAAVNLSEMAMPALSNVLNSDAIMSAEELVEAVAAA